MGLHRMNLSEKELEARNSLPEEGAAEGGESRTVEQENR
jgi:hypothetical protein